MSVSVFGIRHHGPGCARSLRAALEELAPDIVLVEGPPDAQDVLPLLTSTEMKPPVALLIYSPEAPAHAVYYPFATFSPEWQALNYALSRDIPARFMDLPQAFQLGKEETASEIPPQVDTDAPEASPSAQAAAVAEEEPGINENDKQKKDDSELDPLDLLARAAGYNDYELWWERQIEQRRDMSNLFDGILEAMSEMRLDPTPKNDREAQREAYMRQTIRTAQKEGFQRIAVICGAWHSPVLTEEFVEKTKGDAALLKDLKKIKVEATWIPWTNTRLSYRSGYGAGVNSPGWYEHIWTAPDMAMIRWITQAAQLLRSEGLDASSASVIEAVRLGDALAAMRGLPMPGLAELQEAIMTVLCHGNMEPMELIRQRLEIGDLLGEVPSATPAVPLQRDLENKQKRLRFKPTTAIENLDLDLRKEGDRARSQLLHQLRLLGVDWGKPQRGSRRQLGTFHEYWQTQWQVEFVVKLIEGNVWGNTTESAATGLIRHKADEAEELPELTALLDQAVLAELPDAIEHLLICVQTQAAVASDVRHMMDALPPLVQIVRYGNVRETKSAHLLPVIDGLFERVVIGLPGACSSLDDDAARSMLESMDRTHDSVETLDRDEQRSEWQRVLRSLVERDGVHGLVRGRCCRLLYDQHAIDSDELQRLARLSLSTVVPAAQAAAWIEGVLRGSGQLLLHQDGLWLALDAWLGELTPDTFVELLPLLRRAFSGFSGPERRSMGEKAKHLRAAAVPGMPATSRFATGTMELNHERAAGVLPVLAQILGVKINGN
ncbi:MAG TPA: DUF5682 family protein [Ktedonobacteraceae bacterium]|nr:DUF5682 family protein [Ktedonobacteraceae bacterium]